jgi:hypothetical protein
MLRAPLDILADKLRVYVGLVDDLCERPRKVLAACEALMPHLTHFALATADPQRHLPLGFWMHRGCVPFVSFDQFRDLFWATLKPIVQELWAHGHRTLFYAEGNWNHHLAAFAESPERSIVFRIPGVCVPWSAARADIGNIPGAESICCDVWNQIDSTVARMMAVPSRGMALRIRQTTNQFACRRVILVPNMTGCARTSRR